MGLLILSGVLAGMLIAAIYFKSDHAATRHALAHAQSDAEGLRERLDEARETLQRKEQAIQSAQHRVAGLDKELARLSATHAEKLANFDELKQSFEHSRQQLKTEFQNLANQILEEKGKTFAHNSQVSLDALLKPFREQISG